APLRQRVPGTRLLLTHGTATGREAGQALVAPGDLQLWLPYDTPAAVRRFLARFRPLVGVLMETEIWPNLLDAAHEARVPMVLAAVTREGEEDMLLEAWIEQPAPRPLLVIVPRHPQRFDEVADLVRARRLTLVRRSQWLDDSVPSDAAQADVWLGDSMREMP